MNRPFPKHRIALLAICFLAPWGARAADVPGVTDTEVVIGAHTNESGNFAQFVTFPKGMTAYFDMINEKGGIHGRKIKFIRSDCINDSTKCLEVSKSLVERDHIFAMVGGQANVHNAVYKYLIEKGVPDMYFTDAVAEYLTPQRKTVFPFFYPWPVETRTLVRYFAEKHPGKKVCQLYTSTPLGEEYNTSMIQAVNDVNKKKPGSLKLGKSFRIDKSAVQADSEILSMKQDGCDIVMLSTVGTLTSSAINFGVNNGFKPVWSVQTYNINPKFISLLDEGAREGIVSAVHVAREKELGGSGWDAYEKLMKEKNVTVGGGSAIGVAIAETFVEVLKRAGRDLTRESLIKAAESMKGYQCSLCLQPMDVTKADHWPFKSAKVIGTQGGKWVLF